MHTRHAIEALRRWLTAIATGVRDADDRTTIRDSFRVMATTKKKEAFDKLKEQLYSFLRSKSLQNV